MVELVKFIVTGLVDKKDEVVVTMGEDNTVNIKVDKSDMGKVIGKDGRIAKAIRTVVKAAAIHEDKRIVVEIVQ